MTKRVWDDFLTAQDKASLSERPHVNYGFGERPALILIDLYRWVFGDRPQPLLEAIKEWPGSCGMAGWDALPHIVRLLEAARKAEIPVIHITGLDGAGIQGWSEQGRTTANGKRGTSSPDKLARRFDIVDEVAPRPGEVYLRKTSPSAFWGTPLMAALNAARVDTILVAGESTSGCVRATVVDGRTNRFNMLVAEECVFDRHQACHAINLFDMHQKYADVLPVAELIDHLAARTARELAAAGA
jgi:nicotinamidase-related amidase